jgi:hypothetical protein
LFGIFLGLTYLTKGTGLVVCIMLLISHLIICIVQKKKINNGIFSGYLVALGITLPYLIRNFILFGSPTYTIANYIAYLPFYVDSYGTNPSLYLYFGKNLPSLVTYVSALGISGLIARIGHQLFFSGIRLFPFVLPGIIGLFFLKKKEHAISVSVLFILTFILYTSYWVFEFRYYTYIYAIFLPAFSFFALDIFPGFVKKAFINIDVQRTKKVIGYGFAILIISLMAFGISKFFVNLELSNLKFDTTPVFPYRQPEFLTNRLVGYSWIRENIGKNEVIMSSRARETNYYTKLKTLQIPSKDINDFFTIVNRYNATYLIYSPNSNVEKTISYLEPIEDKKEFTLIYSNAALSLYKISRNSSSEEIK